MVINTPKQIKESFPLSLKELSFLNAAKIEIKNILLKKNLKKIVFIGPCSIHNEKEIIDYAKEIKELSKKLKNIYLIMRFYYEKPRSSIGWRGFVNDPDLDESYDISKGILLTRKLMIKLIKMEIPLATEILDPFTVNYFSDLISFGFIGSRTALSQIHRNIASAMNIPMGIKNPPDGNIDAFIGSLIATKSPSTFFHLDENNDIEIIKARGNSFSLPVLRGLYEKVNYNPSYIYKLKEKMKIKNLSPPIIVDCSHANSKKNLLNQKIAFEQSLKNSMDLFPDIVGFMLESYIERGAQKLSCKNKLKYGVSITDPCLSLKDTMSLLYFADQSLSTSISLVQN